MSQNITSAIFGGNVVLSRAGGATGNLSAVASTAAKTYTIQNVTYTVGGKLYYKATASGATTPTTDLNTGAAFKALGKNQACAYVWTLDASGNVGLAQGPLPVQAGTTGTVTNVDDSGNLSGALLFPSIPDTATPFAYMVVKTTSSYAGTGFIPGSSDNWNATGVTTTTADVFALPPSPQAS